MLPGVDGHLLSSAYIEQMLPAIAEPADVVVVRGTLTTWRAACAGLGPASTPRAMLQSATALFAALGFEPPERLEPADPAIAATLASHPEREQLTPRELEVLEWMVQGLSNKEIAAAIGGTEETAKIHLKSIFAKLKVATRTEAVRVAVSRGLVHLD